ncbi:tetraacyldisaccharide 4'-kinase [Flavobacterium sp.]|jgi:tetraacyldisaccharide 4'-kinase|uniref:tetraacyldisaccharide 4'-kinase n=1 Tax=Flavobacterium sp. TaxID=239 RepID=UPI0037BE742E
MILLRKIFFPFSILYGIVTAIRNYLYDQGFLKSYSFQTPVIVVGNLSVGGTGKTPQIEYLIRLFSDRYRVATLSRGYKRKSEGFVLANEKSTVEEIGDEPFQFFKKFDTILVAVDAHRKNGIEQLLLQEKKPEIILLDDAFQHRKVKAGFYILLTSFADLYADDCMLPAGNLREYRSNANRADVIIVTKCPPNLSQESQQIVRNKLNSKENQHLFFSAITYDEYCFSEHERKPVELLKQTDKVLVAGIAKPEPFFDYLKNDSDVVLKFSDHHDFTSEEIESIRNQASGKPIITTEKDFMRLQGKIPAQQLFYLPIQSSIIAQKDLFDQILLNYVGQSSGNC